MGACASKSSERSQSSGGAGEPDAVQRVKTPTAVQNASQGELWATDQVYFADIRILTDLKADCDPSLSRSEKSERILEARLESSGENQKVVFSSLQPMPRALFNLRLRAVGFDEISLEGSVYQGSSSDLPYGLQLRWRPDNSVEVRFLDTTQRIKLESTPVASFSAQEERGGCKILHSVNLFSENAGHYPFQKP